jgi:predicted nucleic acid-binding protein
VSTRLVVDASAFVDVLLGNDRGGAVAARIEGHELHTAAHFDAEVLFALGRLHRAGNLSGAQVRSRLEFLVQTLIERHPLAPFVVGSWGRRRNLRLNDVLYVELAEQLECVLVTTDRRLAASAAVAEFVVT